MMKKILLGTSAIVGASVLLASPVWAAEKPTLKIDGWLRFEAWGVSQDVAGSRAASNNNGFYVDTDDIEIHFSGSAKADNGLEYGFYVEVAESNGSAMQYDEANVFLAGNWGRLDLGSQDSIQNTWKVGGYSVLAGKDGAWDGEMPVQTLSNTARINTDLMSSGDGNGVTYYSPSFSGFQVGASFQPNNKAEMNSGYRPEAATELTNVYGLGARYAGKFSDVGVEVTARYEHGVYGLNDTTVTTTEKEDAKEWGFGAKVSFQGFSVAGSYTDLGNSGVTKSNKAAGVDAGAWWDVGVAYATGPYAVSVGYMQSKASQATGTQDDKADVFVVGASYSAAPGLDFYTQYEYVDLDRTGTASDNQVDLFLIGTQVSF